MSALVWGACRNCKRVFGYDFNKVSTIRIKGMPFPLCEDCVELTEKVKKLYRGKIGG